MQFCTFTQNNFSSFDRNEQEQFFYRDYLLQYHTASATIAKNAVPGATYFKKILKFFDDHYRVGELCMDSVKMSCKNIKCNFCILWSGIPTTRVPQPVPDPMRPSNFLNVSITPTHKENDEEREVDDWQPRASITKLFKAGKINKAQGELVAELDDKFYLNKEHVLNYVHWFSDRFRRD